MVDKIKSVVVGVALVGRMVPTPNYKTLKTAFN